MNHEIEKGCRGIVSLPEGLVINSEDHNDTNEFDYDMIFPPGRRMSRIAADEVPEKYQVPEDLKKIETQCVTKRNLTKSESKAKREHEADPGTEEETKTKMMCFDESLPSIETALFTNHIINKIFSHLQLQDLFVCRLVSRHFQSVAQKPLENLLAFSFSGQNLVSTSKSSLDANASDSEKEKSLSNLLEDLRKGSVPVADYSFEGTPLGDPVLQDFLSTNGHNIEHLSLTDLLHYSHAPHENEVMDQLANLLRVQTPNLRSLKISFGKFEMESILEAYWYSTYPVLSESDPAWQKIITKWNSEMLPLNNNLKSLKMSNFVNAKILETIVCLCPSLEKVELGENYSDLIYLLSPTNRLRFIKSLEIKPTDVNREDFKKMMEILSTDSNPTLKLRDVNFNYSDAFVRYSRENKNVFLKTTVCTMSSVLKSSWDSLVSIKFVGEDFPDGIKWPGVMPEVRHLSLEIEFEYPSRTRQLHPTSKSFLSGLNWSDVFPNLESLELFLPKFCDDLHNLFTWLKVEGPMPKVKRVSLFKVISERMLTQLNSFLRVSFPNAHLKR